MTTIHNRKVMITDLDEETDQDEQQQQQQGTKNNKATSSTAKGISKTNATTNTQRTTKVGATKKKVLNTLSGNFSRRSRSAECHAIQQQQQEQSTNQRGILSGQVPTSAAAAAMHKCSKEKAQSFLNELLKGKDEQLEKLLQRLATLHKYNEQFAEENQQLQRDVMSLQQRIETLRKQIANCDKCQRLSKQLECSMEAQKTLDADVAMLKTLVYRLNVQIEAYQDQLRLKKSEQGDTATNEFLPQTTKSACNLQSQWQQGVLATHTLSPLLSSYDEMLRDKDDLIQQYRQEFEHFTSELKRTIEENNRLLQQNASLKRNFGNWREERTRLQAQLEVCRAKVEAQAEKSDLAKEKLVEVMHCYEQKVQTLVLDLEHTQSAYVRCKNELATLKSLQAQPQEPIAQSLQNCKQLLEELKQQHGKDKQNFEQTIHDLQTAKQTLERRLADTENENSALRKECEELVATKIQLEKRVRELEYAADVIKQSRERLKSRLRIALQWAQRLEQGQSNIQNTYDALKRLETIVKHKEAQVRGLQTRHLQEIDKFEKKLAQKDETIRTILKGKLASAMAEDAQK